MVLMSGVSAARAARMDHDIHDDAIDPVEALAAT
jgi:hypothetical protein